jgi:hypothetical protein
LRQFRDRFTQNELSGVKTKRAERGLAAAGNERSMINTFILWTASLALKQGRSTTQDIPARSAHK